MKDLVSIITPCYNGESLVHRLLDSILLQTYSNIELILVDDGSTDSTKEIVLSYKEKFKKRGFKLFYIYQNNTGLAGAINTGLKEVKGKYLCWPDADDYFEAESIEKRVEIFEKYPDYGVVTSDAYVRSINNLDGYLRIAGDNQSEKFLDNQFEILLSGNSMFIPGTHMARSSFFFETHPEGQIFPCRRGQNWQMLLPLFYKYKRYFLDEPLYNYIIYDTSMSQGDNTEEKKIYRCNEHEEIITKTLASMNIEHSVRDKYIFETKIRYTRKRLTIAFLHRNKLLFKEMYDILEKEKQPRSKEYLYRLIIKNSFVHRVFTKLLPLLRSVFTKFNDLQSRVKI
jgi:glycosyltransferase involved in cell wall biosynthesis